MLPRTVFLRAVGSICGPVLRSTVAVALSARSIAGAGLHVLSMVLNTQMRGVVGALGRWSTDESASSSSDADSLTASATIGPGGAALPDRFVPGWARAAAVAEVLEAPLATIRIRVEARAFRGALTHSELSRVIHALFAASPNRSALLRVLEQQAAADATGASAAVSLDGAVVPSRPPPARPVLPM